MRHPFLRHWLLCSLLFVLTACDLGRTEPRPLRLTTVKWVGFIPFYVARDLQLYPPPGLDIIRLSSGLDATHAFLHRRADMTAGSLTEAIRFIDQGADLKIILVTDQSNGADGIVARQGISTVEDLRGKRIAVEIGTEAQYLLIRALSLRALSVHDVKVVSMPPEACIAALEQGEVDAAALWEPFLTIAREKGMPLLFSSKQLPGEIFDVVLVQRDAAETRREEITGVLQAWHRAAQALKQPDRRGEAQRSALRYLGTSTESLSSSLAGVEITDLEQNRRLLDRGGQEASLWRAYELTARFMVEHGLVKSPPPDAGVVIDAQLVDRALAARP
ncbi:ABC transporter substrate-binding protein [Sorangium sp. So ce1335]|uniref:ABC transporter substrate-binding protein n=1 Tax=Sorangium sp. So ce1335 TaxID=3133335 RepID=UPI003F631EBE